MALYVSSANDNVSTRSSDGIVVIVSVAPTLSHTVFTVFNSR
jgi:hypothetical protein